uniref:Reverse transcriptase domain-containing protein n=1 Tax=Tanacetum cinerariifolium TaxID=118510 RepID=A0A6L2NMG5_TANCI|nr:hypothetical protein [Tanacetum cinerariifolium]
MNSTKYCSLAGNKFTRHIPIAKLTYAVNQQTSVVTTAKTAILKEFQATPPFASVKAVDEICVTCGGAHPYYQCLAVDVNTFLELRDNIQGYVSAAAVNYNQGNFGYRPPVVPLSELEKIKKMNEINMKAMQTQINNVKNELRNEIKNLIQASMSNQTYEPKNMMASFFQMITASTSGSRPLPSNIIANPKGELKSITTRSGIVIDGPFIPMHHPIINPEEDERVEETLTDQDLAEYTIMVPPPLIQKPKPPSQRNFICLPELISTQMTLELANRAICTLAGIARDVVVLVGKFTFPVDFVIVDYESDPRVPLILGRPFLRTAHALTDVHREEMILYLSVTSHLSGNPTFSSHTNLTSLEVKDDIFDPEGDIILDSTKDLPPLYNINPLSGSTTCSSPNHLLEEFVDELAFITFPLRSDDLPFDIEFDLKEIEYLLNHDPIMEMDYILEDLIDESNLADLNDNLVDTMPEISSDFLPSLEYDLFFFEDFSKVDALPSTNNEDKVFNLDILIYENLFEVITHAILDKNVNKIAISHASLILEDFDPPLYELPFYKKVPRSKKLLSFSSKNEEKVFKPGILTSKGVHSSLL